MSCGGLRGKSAGTGVSSEMIWGDMIRLYGGIRICSHSTLK